jgi:hypothetical protein
MVVGNAGIGGNVPASTRPATRLQTSEASHGVRMDQGPAHHRRHLVDGGNALSAAVVCLSLRSRTRIEAVRDVQGDGTAAAEGDHQSGDDRNVVGRALPGMVRSLVFGAVVARKTAAGGAVVRSARFFFPVREGFCRRPQSTKPEILPNYQRGTDIIDDRDRHFGGRQTVLSDVIPDKSR